MSEHITDSYHIISTQWTMHDLVDAHIALDAVNEFALLDRAGI